MTAAADVANAYNGDRDAIRKLLAGTNASTLGAEQRSTCASLARLYDQAAVKLRGAPGGAEAMKDLALPPSAGVC